MNTICGSGFDDTAKVQQAVNDIRTKGGKLHLVGDVAISSLNATQLTRGIVIEGEGPFGTRIIPIADSNSVIDYSGSFGVTIRDLQIGVVGQSVRPATALLGLQTKNLVGNIIRFDNVFVTGHYTVATWYSFGMASSRYSGLHLWNYQTGGYAAYLGSDNYNNMNSPYLPANPDGYSVATGGNHPNSDIDLFGCEFHGQAPSGAADIKPVHIRGGIAIRFWGGNMSGSGNELVTLDGDMDGRTCKKLAFMGMQFYSENGTLPKYIFRANAGVSSLLVDSCDEYFQTALVEGENNVTLIYR